ncbi:MAG: two-component regulator propeller domain-containing protein [Actinomycetota bacterium]
MIFGPVQKQSIHPQFTLIAWAALFFLLALISKAERLPVKTYTVADGLLRDTVTKIKQDSRGFLWFCTAEGISRFDGYAFTNFTNNDGLPDRHVNDFLETKSGAIYVATDGGLAKINPTGLSNSKDNPLFTVILPDNPKTKQINLLFEDENGTVWAGTSNGLYKLNGQEELESVNLGKLLTDIEEISVNTIIKDRRGAMWIGTESSGLFRLLPGGEAERFTTENGLPDGHITSLLEDKNGRIWVGLSPHIDSGLCLLTREPNKNQKIVERFFTLKDGLPSSWITDLSEDGDKFWIATTRGLCLWQGANSRSVCKTYTAKNDLCDYDIWTMTKDKDGNLWTGSKCGAKKWARYGFTSYSEADGTANPLVNSIFENAAGELFVSFNDGTGRPVSRFDGEKFELVKPNFPADIGYFGWGWKQTVWQDRTGDWWFPTGYGLYRFPHPARFEDLAKTPPQKIKIGSKFDQIFRIFEDFRSDIWISTISDTGNKLWRWERANNTWHDHTQESVVEKKSSFSSFAEDQSGNLWIGTTSEVGDAALIRYRDGQFKTFTRNDNQLLAGSIRDLFVDHGGRLWIANIATGLLRLDDVNADRLNFVRYTPAEGLSSIGVHCLTEDEFGRIYIGTGRGLDRLNPETGQVENFTTADGLPNSFLEVAYRDKKNNLWFGTANGLARFQPEPEHQRQMPNALIMSLRVSGEAQSVSILGAAAIQKIELNSDQKQVSVDFLGLGASLGEKMRYEYRLNNALEWISTLDRTVNFANLNSGEYLFEVRTITADRLYSESATVAFRIAAPVWQRWWFIASILILTALAVYLFYKNRLARLLEMERMRTLIATDLHDDIGANLTRISMLSEVAKNGRGNGNLLTSIADIARESVASMNDIVWAIAPEHDNLLDLTRRMRQHAEEIFALREIDLEFHAPTADTDLKLSVGVRRDVLLIFKEAVNNSARHSDCSQVEIEFRVNKAVLFLQIKDNGKGFAADFESDGQGLRSMTRRARALRGNLKIDSKKGAGTTVEFELPFVQSRALRRNF